MPDSPTSSGQLAAELAPGLLLDGEEEDPGCTCEANDPSFLPEADDQSFEPDAEVGGHSLGTAHSSPVTHSTALPEVHTHVINPSAECGAMMDTGNAASGLSAVASELCAAKCDATRNMDIAGQPVRAALATLQPQTDEESGQSMLAPGKASCFCGNPLSCGHVTENVSCLSTVRV